MVEYAKKVPSQWWHWEVNLTWKKRLCVVLCGIFGRESVLRIRKQWIRRLTMRFQWGWISSYVDWIWRKRKAWKRFVFRLFGVPGAIRTRGVPLRSYENGVLRPFFDAILVPKNTIFVLILLVFNYRAVYFHEIRVLPFQLNCSQKCSQNCYLSDTARATWSEYPSCMLLLCPYSNRSPSY